MSKSSLYDYGRFFDHTCLKANAMPEDIVKLCHEAEHYHFRTVCVNPFYVPYAKKLLRGTSVKVCTVIGFPLGASTIESKRYEALDAVSRGANEVDMVQNIAMAKAHDYLYIEREIRAIKEAIQGRAILKVILETCYLTKKEIACCSMAAQKAGADFVKTSTGFGPKGADPRDVLIMRKAVGPKMGVKASGGIHTREDVFRMFKAGANRIGCSASVSIMKEIMMDENKIRQ